MKGATVVGIAGSDDKCRWLTDELGFDYALNYKAPDFKEKFLEVTKVCILTSGGTQWEATES